MVVACQHGEDLYEPILFSMNATYARIRRTTRIPAKFLQATCSIDIAPHPVMRMGSMILPENRLVNIFRGRSQSPLGM